MSLDIRIPIGLLFAILGGLLDVFGLVTFGDKALYQRSLGYDINLWWGSVMLIFGLAMVYFGRRGPRTGPGDAGDVPAEPRRH